MSSSSPAISRSSISDLKISRWPGMSMLSSAGSSMPDTVSVTMDAPWSLFSLSKSITLLVSLSYTPSKSPSVPIGQLMGTDLMPSTFSSSSMRSNGFLVARSILFMNVNIGIPRLRQTWKSLIVCASTPFAPSSTMTAASAAQRVRYVSSEKSWCPGVSRILMWQPSNSNCITEDVTEIPRFFSISIQSEVA